MSMHGIGHRSVGLGIRTRALIGVIASALTLAAAAGTANASVTISSFTATPSTTVAGGHPNLTTTTNFSYSDSSDDVKSVQVSLPPGMLGNPTVVAQCTLSQLSSDSCPANSKIGTTSVTANVSGLPLPLTANGDVYNVTPVGSEPARIGMVVRPGGGLVGKFSMSGPVSIRIPGDFGLTTTFDNLPRTLPPLLGGVALPDTIKSISLTLDGFVNGGTAAFMRNPTSCKAAYIVESATSYESSNPSAKLDGFTPTDCAHEPFNPGISFSFSAQTASTPSGLTVNVTVPGNDIPRSQSDVRANVVFLPVGTAINPAALVGIQSCTDAQLNVSSASTATCPAGSQVGTVSFTTPVIGTLSGQVFFATGTAQNPLRLFIQINIKGKYAKLIVNNGFYGPFILSSLSNLPQSPFTSFSLTFNGGSKALVKTPPCGTTPGIGWFFPYSGNQMSVAVDRITISQTSTGAPCPTGTTANQALERSVARDLTSLQGKRLTPRQLTRAVDRIMARHHLHMRHRPLR